jgi:hypothetical protein
MGFCTLGFEWNVRFDHEPLARGLESLGFVPQRRATHVLPLRPDYHEVFAGFNATIRNQVRRACRSVLVEDAKDVEDLQAYYQVHCRLSEQKGAYGFCTLELLRQLFPLGAGRLILARYQGRVAAGGMFLRDGCSVMYFHGAADRAYSRHFPACAVLDEAIRWACQTGASTFNFGGSGGIASLEQFKSFWGARLEYNWTFSWTNPVVKGMALLKSVAFGLPRSLLKARRQRGRQ